MLTALVRDFSRLRGCQVATLLDSRCQRAMRSHGISGPVVGSAKELRDLFRSEAAHANSTVLVAPECDGSLLRIVRWAEAAQARLISPNSEFVRWASDKHRTAARLRHHGMASTLGWRWDRLARSQWKRLPFPLIVKPADGAGCHEVRRINRLDDLAHFQGSLATRSPSAYRLEPLYPGRPASISALCGPSGPTWLPACWQLVTGATAFHYRGGRTMRDRHLAHRVRNLVAPLAPELSKVVGYIGIDVILGPGQDGRNDLVLEVNPRLTTSYVGLRTAAMGNLAEWMLRAARGQSVKPRFQRRCCHFRSNGTAWLDDAIA